MLRELHHAGLLDDEELEEKLSRLATARPER
jgi:hypothetical protein